MSNDLQERLRLWAESGDLDAAIQLAVEAARRADLETLHQVGRLLAERADAELVEQITAWQTARPNHLLGRSQRREMSASLPSVSALVRWTRLLPEVDLLALLSFATLDDEAIRDEQRTEIALQGFAAEPARYHTACQRLRWALSLEERWYRGSARGYIEGGPPEIKVRSTALNSFALTDAVDLALNADERCRGVLARLLAQAFAHPAIHVPATPEVLAARDRGREEYEMSVNRAHLMMSRASSVLASSSAALSRHPEVLEEQDCAEILIELLSRVRPFPTLEVIVEALMLVISRVPEAVQDALIEQGVRCSDGDCSRAEQPLGWLLRVADGFEEARAGRAREVFWMYVTSAQWSVRAMLMSQILKHLEGEMTPPNRLLAETHVEVLRYYAEHSHPHMRAFAASLWSRREGNPWALLDDIFEMLAADPDAFVQRVLVEDGDTLLRDLSFDLYY